MLQIETVFYRWEVTYMGLWVLYTVQQLNPLHQDSLFFILAITILLPCPWTDTPFNWIVWIIRTVLLKGQSTHSKMKCTLFARQLAYKSGSYLTMETEIIHHVTVPLTKRQIQSQNKLISLEHSQNIYKENKLISLAHSQNIYKEN